MPRVHSTNVAVTTQSRQFDCVWRLHQVDQDIFLDVQGGTRSRKYIVGEDAKSLLL